MQGSGLARWFYVLTWLMTSAYCYTSLQLNTLNPIKWAQASANRRRASQDKSKHEDSTEELLRLQKQMEELDGRFHAKLLAATSRLSTEERAALRRYASWSAVGSKFSKLGYL